jgi:hypothetical protein
VEDFLQIQLSLLEKIQKIDIEVTGIEGERDSYPRKKELINEEVSGLEAEVDSISLVKDDLERQRAAAEGEIVAWDERIKRNEERLKDIKNEKQFKAVGKEVNTATKKKAEIAKEVLRIVKLLETKHGELDNAKERLNQKKEECEFIELEMKQLTAEWERALAEKKTERDAVAAKVSPDILRRYELIKNKRHGIGLVLARDSTCRGCHMNIPPQLYIQLRKGPDELIVCPHCHRILYIDEKTSV